MKLYIVNLIIKVFFLKSGIVTCESKEKTHDTK